MALDIYLAYLAATFAVLVIPGPTVLLVISYALTEGRRAALSMVAGVALGDLTALCLSLAGLGALLSTSAALFTALKWIGACYLIYLGLKMWRNPAHSFSPDAPIKPQSNLTMLGHAFVVTAINPKSIIFFVAFLPQFIRPEVPVMPQLFLLGCTFLVLAIINALAYALLAGRVRTAVQRPAVIQAINRFGGSLLIGAGLLTAASRRTLAQS